MQPNEKTNDKANLQANQQPKKTWEDPAMTKLVINTGGNINPSETGTYYALQTGSNAG